MIDVTNKTFNEYTVDRPTIIVDFWASWCPPCQRMNEVLEEFESRHPDVTILKVNVDEEQELMVSHKVESIPTYVYYQNGEVVDTLVGVQDISKLEELVGIHP